MVSPEPDSVVVEKAYFLAAGSGMAAVGMAAVGSWAAMNSR
jgi:hypothetical protein